MSKQPVKRGLPARDQFVNMVLADGKLGRMAIRVGARLGMYLNCTHGQCDPGYPTIADALGVSERSVIRAVAELEARGWIEVDRADGKINNKFRLFMIEPDSVNGVTTAVTPDADDQDPDGVTEILKWGDKNAFKNGNGVTTAVTQNTEKENTEKDNSAASPRALCSLLEESVTEASARLDAALFADEGVDAGNADLETSTMNAACLDMGRRVTAARVTGVGRRNGVAPKPPQSHYEAAYGSDNEVGNDAIPY
jgi:hypothetical protein